MSSSGDREESRSLGGEVGSTDAASDSTAHASSLERQAVLFDLDRTLVRGDTASLWMRYEFEKGRVPRSRLLQVAWWKLRYTFGAVDAEYVARSALGWFAGRDVEELEVTTQKWFEERVRTRISREARAAVKAWQARDALVVIVTAASQFAATPVAKELGVSHLICTEVEVKSGKLTGGTTAGLCYGASKVQRAEAFLLARGHTLGKSTVFTDSITDLPLLEACNTPICVNPDPRLRRLARKRGWGIELWKSDS